MRQPVHYMAKYTAICNRTKCNAIGVIVGRFLFKQAILVLAFVCSFTKTHTTATSSLASARKKITRSSVATNFAVASYKDTSLSEIVIVIENNE